MKNQKKLSALLALLPAVVLASCGGSSGEGVYTLREYTQQLSVNWNPHTWEMSNDSDMLGYTTMYWVEPTYNPNGSGYVWTYEMATNITDVTQSVDEATAAKWGVDVTSDTGIIYDVELNPGAKFSTGREITAQTYVDSFERLIDPDMQNYRANNYYSNDTEIAGAYAYFYQGNQMYSNYPTAVPMIEDGSAEDIGEGKIYLDITGCYLWTYLGVTWQDCSAKNEGDYAAYMTVGGVNIVDKYLNEAGTEPNVVELTDEVIADLEATPFVAYYAEITEETPIEFYIGSYHVQMAAATMDDVGMYATDDYTLRVVMANPLSMFYFMLYMGGDWLVDTVVYDANKTTSGGLTTTRYNNDLETAVSYGPYKLASYEDERQATLVRDENWYGWTDGKHEGQFQATNITIDVIMNHSSALQAFVSGSLDGISLETADIATYGLSSKRLNTPESYANRAIFNCSVEHLQTKCDGAENAGILSNENFRKAFNLMIDREELTATAFPGHSSLLGVIGYSYYYDAENNPSSVYREHDYAKEVICDHYGVSYGPGQAYETLDEAYASITGFDVEQAKNLFSTAASEATAAGIWDGTSNIVLTVGVFDASTSGSVSLLQELNKFISNATEGTALAGKVSFTARSYSSADYTRYDAIVDGTVCIAFGAWGGAILNPYSLMRCYFDPEYTDPCHEELSFDPQTETVSITADFDGDGTEETKSDTYEHWVWEINSVQGYASYVNNADLRLYIMSQLEGAFLDENVVSMVTNYGSVSLYSHKISYATTTYDIFYGYGGLRYLTFNYDDAQWAAYVSEQGGTLDYVS